jgi:hydrogenase/urease accessory protein HupE
MTRSSAGPGMARPLLLGVTATTLFPSVAHAHLATTGLGPVYDGVNHLIRSPEDLLPVIAMSLLAGLHGQGESRRVLFALPASWIVGGLAGHATGAEVIPGILTALSCMVAGLFTALDRRMSARLLTGIAIALGLLHGWLNGAGIANDRGEGLALVGIGAAVFVLVAIGAALVVSVKAAWQRIVVRVAGSWVAAVGLLLLGWALR